MREHAHPFGEICPGCLDAAAARIRALEAIAVKDSARAERAEVEVARLNLAAQHPEGGSGGEVSWLEALARIRALEAEVARFRLAVDDVRDDYLNELSAFKMRAERAEAELKRAQAVIASGFATTTEWGRMKARLEEMSARSDAHLARLAEAERFLADEDRCSKWRNDVSDFLSRRGRAEDQECGT